MPFLLFNRWKIDTIPLILIMFYKKSWTTEVYNGFAVVGTKIQKDWAKVSSIIFSLKPLRRGRKTDFFQRRGALADIMKS